MEMNRFDSIMARVDAWAEEGAGWDCRMDAEAEVSFMLDHREYRYWSDDRIVEEAIAAWLMAE